MAVADELRSSKVLFFCTTALLTARFVKKKVQQQSQIKTSSVQKVTIIFNCEVSYLQMIVINSILQDAFTHSTTVIPALRQLNGRGQHRKQTTWVPRSHWIQHRKLNSSSSSINTHLWLYKREIKDVEYSFQLGNLPDKYCVNSSLSSTPNLSATPQCCCL